MPRRRRTPPGVRQFRTDEQDQHKILPAHAVFWGHPASIYRVFNKQLDDVTQRH